MMPKATFIVAATGLLVSTITLYIVVRVGLELDAKTDEVKGSIMSNPLGKFAAKLMGVKL